MKTKLFIPAICLLAGLSFLASCDDNDKTSDVTPPIISLIEPEEGAELLIGSENGVHLEMDLTDDVELKSYRINVHSNFDHHGHTTRADDGTVASSFDQVYDDAAGKKNHHVHMHDIKIPANATPGDYHLMIYCTDAAKNETYIARNIVLSTTAEEDRDDD
ncbi:MAG: DUF4625 domain-containing protein [Bacteroides sp.]|nr:DUF4625 domain-containing protein [Bacteroides sp.]